VAVKRGIAIWISGFLSFLAALGSFITVVYWVIEGPNFSIRPYLLGDYIGQLRIEEYLWISIGATFIFLGLTCIVAYRKLHPDPEIVKMFITLGGNLTTLRKTQETTATEFSDKLENNRRTTEQLFDKTETNLGNFRKDMFDALEKNEKDVQKVRRDLVSKIETKVGETREEMLGLLKKYGMAMHEVQKLSKQEAVAMNEQRTELEELADRLKKMEDALTPLQPRLKSQDDPEEVRGIGPRFSKELKSLGITNVGELVVADSDIIGEKTRISRETAERLQATAQLLMVPGVDEGDAELLLEAGVTSRRELAAQDFVSLGRKIGELVGTYVEEGKIPEDEKPTIEEISSWIRMAKY
jgi:hypothetical protein